MGEKTPWEQHASAAGLPRFNYNALSSPHLLKGFLVTCALDREKSATKEAIAIIRKHFEGPNGEALPRDAGFEVDRNAKHQHCDEEGQLSLGAETVCVEAGDNCALSSYPMESPSEHIAEKNSNKDALSSKRSRSQFEKSTCDDDNGIFCLKMSQKGIVAIFWDTTNSNNPVTMLSKVLADVESESSASLRWCQRMIPIQGSCVYSRKSFSSLVTKLVAKYLEESLPTEMQPLKYAVSFNRRGFELKGIDNLNDSPNNETLDRKSCIQVVTAAVASVAPHTIVDLNAPQMVVIVDVIPLAGAQGSPICGVAVLSGSLVNTKPRLSVKSLKPADHQVVSKAKIQT